MRTKYQDDWEQDKSVTKPEQCLSEWKGKGIVGLRDGRLSGGEPSLAVPAYNLGSGLSAHTVLHNHLELQARRSDDLLRPLRTSSTSVVVHMHTSKQNAHKINPNFNIHAHMHTHTKKIHMWQGIVRAGPEALDGANGKERVLAWPGFGASGSGSKSIQVEPHT